MSRKQQRIQRRKLAEDRAARIVADGNAAAMSVADRELAASAQDPKQHRKVLEKYYHNPPYTSYKVWRAIWAICLALALIFTGLAWGGTDWWEGSTWTMYIVAAYASIIASIVIDFAVLRRMRKAYQREMDPTYSRYPW